MAPPPTAHARDEPRPPLPHPPCSSTQPSACLRALGLLPRVDGRSYTRRELRLAYLQRARTLHPDKHRTSAAATTAATRDFQHLSLAYETLLHRDAPGATPESDTDATYEGARDAADDTDDTTPQRYREMYARMMQHAEHLWRTRPETRLVQQLWASWQASVAGDSGNDRGESSNVGGRAEDREHETDEAADGEDNEDVDDSDSREQVGGDQGARLPYPSHHPHTPPHASLPTSSGAHLPSLLALPMVFAWHEIYHNVAQKITYHRYRYAPASKTRTKEDVTVLVPAGLLQMVCYGEGDQACAGGPCGDVVFRMSPPAPVSAPSVSANAPSGALLSAIHLYRLHQDARTLLRIVHVDPVVMCHGTSPDAPLWVDHFGERLAVDVPPRLFARWSRSCAEVIEGGVGAAEGDCNDAGACRLPVHAVLANKGFLVDCTRDAHADEPTNCSRTTAAAVVTEEGGGDLSRAAALATDARARGPLFIHFDVRV